jgi:hypothetical protein
MLAVRACALAAGFVVAGCVYSSREQTAAPLTPSMTVYPGARHTVANPYGDAADVYLRVPFVLTLHITANRYDSTASPSAILTYYRKQLAQFGAVSELAGGPHSRIENFRWPTGPGQHTLDVGDSSGRAHVVSAMPKGGGSEFALIYVDASDHAGSSPAPR